MKAEANASAKYGVGYREGNLYIEAVAEAKLRAEVSLKAEMEMVIMQQVLSYMHMQNFMLGQVVKLM